MTDAHDPLDELRHLDGEVVSLAHVVRDPDEELPPVLYAPDPPAVLHLSRTPEEEDE